EGQPAWSRIQGMRGQAFPPSVLGMLLIPLAALGVLAAALRRGSLSGGLLTHGRLARARLESTARTTMQVNNAPVYRYTYLFADDQGRSWQHAGKTHVRHLLEPGHQPRLLYDPQEPARA